MITIKVQGSGPLLPPEVAQGRGGITSPVEDVRQGEVRDLAIIAVHLTAH